MRRHAAERARVGLGPRRLAHGLLGCMALVVAGLGRDVRAQPVVTASVGETTVGLVEFDPTLLMSSKGEAFDLSRFRTGNGAQPGSYDLDVYLNGEWIDRTQIRFADVGGRIQPCMTRPLLDRLGLDPKGLAAGGQQALAATSGGECVPLPDIVSEATVVVDLNRLRLDASLPQASLVRVPRGYVSPDAWDPGVTAGVLRYNMNAFRASSGQQEIRSTYLGLNGGINHGGWFLRHQGALTSQSGFGTRYENIATYLQKDIVPWQARMTLGDSFTDGAVFDSIGIRGVQLASDDRMLPDSQRGYAPVIRGSARTNARVSVSQNGVPLYETTVAPGPFVIEDLYPTGYGANLQVTITEADGRTSSFVVPYASAPQLVRAGRFRFSAAAGRLRDGVVQSRVNLTRGALQYGLTDSLTAYGGLTAAQGYQSALVGAAFNTPVGAFSADVTGASTDVPGAGARWGQSLRLGYSTFLAPTQTNIGIATYRGSSSGYWDLRSAMAMRDQRLRGVWDNLAGEQERQRLQFTVSQNLGDLGTMYLIGTSRNYWNRSGTQTTAQAGYARTFSVGTLRLGFNIDFSRLRDEATGRTENRVFASINLPLGRGANSPTLVASTMRDSNDVSSQQLRLYGTALDSYRLSYGVFAERNNLYGNNGGGNVQYRASAATVSASASAGRDSRQASFGLSGGIVAHSAGVTFANDLGDTVGIVEAKGATGARVLNGTGIEIDGRGYAVVPYLSPYRLNTVAIDPEGLPPDVQFKSTTQRVAPYASGVVLLRYDTTIGRTAVMRLAMPDGSAPPFGASVLNEAGAEVGIVGQGGRAFVAGLLEAGALRVEWGNGERCRADYRLPPSIPVQDGFTSVEIVCHLEPAGGTVTAQVPEVLQR